MSRNLLLKDINLEVNVQLDACRLFVQVCSSLVRSVCRERTCCTQTFLGEAELVHECEDVADELVQEDDLHGARAQRECDVDCVHVCRTVAFSRELVQHDVNVEDVAMLK